VLLLAGPAGTGKSRLAGEKVHAFLLKYPKATGLILRKTRESLTNSTLLFMERVVIGNDPRVHHLESKHRFEYHNGSILAYGGMKDDEQREQVRGVGVEGGVDILWFEEGIRFSDPDYQEGSGRMRGTAADWTQVLVSTNPGPPGHWIHQQLMIAGKASVYDKARPEDNPYNPPAYIERLKGLTGILRQRLWEGKWVQAEGLVYDTFDLENLTDEEPDPELPFELAFDEGYIDPRAILFIQKKPSEILVFDEIYHSRHLAETCVSEAVRMSGDHFGIKEDVKDKRIPKKLPEIAVGSPEAKEMQARLRSANIPYRSRPHEIVEGLQVVRELICDGNGYRTLKVHRGRCPNLIRELTEGYQYPEAGKRSSSEKPLDKDNHAADALRYWSYLRAR